jgi:AraC-like DNA-binding protein
VVTVSPSGNKIINDYKEIDFSAVGPASLVLENHAVLGNLSVFRLTVDGQKFPLQSITRSLSADKGVVVLAPLAGHIAAACNDTVVEAGADEMLALPAHPETIMIARALVVCGLHLPDSGTSSVDIPTLLKRDSITAQSLMQQLIAVTEWTDPMDHRTSRYFGQSLTALASAALLGPAHRTQAQDCLVTERFRQHVQDHLFDVDLKPAGIARALGLSRSALYRVAEPLGGIARYIQNKRLEHAHRCLSTKGLPPTTVTGLAHELGFGSEATFRRLFKKKYGVSPRDMMR